MRDFSWDVFEATGDIDAYLLYKLATATTPNPEREISDSEEMDGEEPTIPYH